MLDNDLQDPNSIMIKLTQIQNGGKVKITYDNFSIIFHDFDDQPSFAKGTTQYEREITHEDLENLYYNITFFLESQPTNNQKIENEVSEIYHDFKNCFEEVTNLHKLIQILYNYGKSFTYEVYFYHIDEIKKIKTDLTTLFDSYKTNATIDYPPFLTKDNLLMFGSLLQGRKRKEVQLIAGKMFNLDYTVVNEALNKLYETTSEIYINDPIKSSAKLFSTLFEKISNIKTYDLADKSTKLQSTFDPFSDFQRVLQLYFSCQNLLSIKVDTPSETFHVLPFISNQLYNNFHRRTYFYENFFCYEDSDINLLFSDIKKMKNKSTIKYIFIIHPEFLSITNQNALNEIISSRIMPIPDMSLQKIVIITSSSKFISGKPADDLNGRMFTRGEASMKVNATEIRNYCNQGGMQFYFSLQIIQSLKPSSGKTTYINHQIEKIINENKKYKFQVFHHFITDGNQPIPINSFQIPKKGVKNIIHFQFDDEIMNKGIKFWSLMHQLYTNGFILPAKGEPLIISEPENNLVIFEIPQLRKENLPLQNLNEFPLSVSSKFPNIIEKNDEFSFTNLLPGPFDIEDTILNTEKFQFKESKDLTNLYENCIKKLKKKPENQKYDLNNYIKLIYNIIFKSDIESKEIEISNRKLSYMEKYLYKFTNLFYNSLPRNMNLKFEDDDRFIAFFYLLTISLFYSYNCLPKEKEFIDDEKKWIKGNGLTFFTVDDLFSCRRNIKTKRFHFYSTKSGKDLFKHLDISDSYLKNEYFTTCFNYKGENPYPYEALQKIFCSSEEFSNNIVENFKKKHPQSYITHKEVTIPTLFRSTVILSRIFLSQPIILSGDTGCGKTFLLMLLFEYFNLLINETNVKVGKILNCHGGIRKKDILNHLKEAPHGSKKHIIFFDELNTSPDSSFIEQLILNVKEKFHCKFTFIGALNPWIKKNPISSILTQVGLPQRIKEEEKICSVIEKESTEKEKVLIDDISDLMYHVNYPQEATKDIIFDFNPFCYEEKYKEEDLSYPTEEKKSVHLIIKDLIKIKRKDIISNLENNIDKCIIFIRRLMNERAVISYRDIKRTMIMFNELLNRFGKNEEILNDLPLIITIVSFVLRLPDQQEIPNSIIKENKMFQKAFVYYFGNKDNKYRKTLKVKGVTLIKIRDRMISLLGDNVEQIKKKFMTFVYLYTFDFLIDKSIWKFKSTFIHLFIMDLCIHCKLPCFIIGMPGTSKSYAIELLKKYYGEKLYVSYYMSSRTSSPDGIKSQFYDAIYKEISNKKENKKDHYCVVFIDEMGNANINPSRPLKFLHGILDHGLVLNNTGYSYKVATIGVSNYTMDFANMNRGVLVYTGLPKLEEIINVFSYDNNKNNSLKIIGNSLDEKIAYINSFIENQKNIKNDNICNIFHLLWPNKMPKTIALRSIYNMRFLLDKKKFNIHDITRISRELFNSKRLAYTNNYNNLISQLPALQNINDEYKNIDNLACFLERVTCKDTISNKSLSVFTKNYEAIEYFSLFKDNKFITFLLKQYKNDKNLLSFDHDMFEKFKYTLFAEDFKKKPELISQEALNKITECISSNNNDNILFIGNHPCFDSCLDLLNVPHSDKNLQREVILGSGFSFKFLLTNTKFYILMIANIDDIKNESNSENPFSEAFLDRTETVYLDWQIIGPYYLQYKYNELNPQNSLQLCKDMQNILNEQLKYETIKPANLHQSIEILYNNKKNIDLNNKFLSDLIIKRWMNGIKSVILTRSKITEELYLPPNINKQNIIDENDRNIQDFESLKELINSMNPIGEKFIIIKCSYFDKLHFAHLKTFFDEISSNIHYNIFIVYYGCDPKDFEGSSSFMWPIFSMDDITIHPELETRKITQKNKEPIKITKQVPISEIIEMVYQMNHMDKIAEFKDTENCKLLFSNIFDIIIRFADKEHLRNGRNLQLIERYSDPKSLFQSEDFFDVVKDKLESIKENKYFNIIVKDDNIINLFKSDFKLSLKSKIITIAYQKLFKLMQPFFVFQFGTIEESERINSDRVDFLLKCNYLELSLTSFIIDPSIQASEVESCLYKDYINFLLNNNSCFDEIMKKKKCIADRLLDTIGLPKNAVPKITALRININFPDFDESDKTIIYFQTFIDYTRYRSFSGIILNEFFNNDSYCYKFIKSCIFRDSTINVDKKKSFRGDGKYIINRSSMIDSIVEFRNRSIFDIFKFPTIRNEQTNAILLDICKDLMNIKDPENDDKYYQLFKDFNERKESLKSDKIKDKLKNIDLNNNNEFNKENVIISMLIYNALLEYKPDEYKPDEKKTDEYKSDKYKPDEKKPLLPILIDKNVNIQLKPNIKIFNYTRSSLFWDVHNEVEYSETLKKYSEKYCLIDDIQSIINIGSTDKKACEFRDWLFSGFKKKEPLAIIALKKYLKTKTEEDMIILAKILDPFFGDFRIVEPFVKYIENQKNQENPNKEINFKTFYIPYSYRIIFKFFDVQLHTDHTVHAHCFNLALPTISQIIWYHAAFNNPDKYPLLTLIIKETPFFIDFKAAPKIVYSILHLRHIFSYNRVFIPIILHCTSLFKNCNCKLLLYSLNYFDTKNKEFENIQEDIDILEEYIKQNYAESYEILRQKSAYYQIDFVYRIYFKKYNEIIEKIHDYSFDQINKNKKFDLEIVEPLLIVPNTLITKLSLNNTLMTLIYRNKLDNSYSFDLIERKLCELFALNLFIEPYDDDQRAFPLFKVSYGNKTDKDFVGFSKKDYETLFLNYQYFDKSNLKLKKIEGKNDSVNFHASILALLLKIYFYKRDDYYENYLDIKDVNDISNCHLDNYGNKIDYSLRINGVKVDPCLLYFEDNEMYPLQNIFMFIPSDLRNEIRNYQENKNGLKIIVNEDELKNLEKNQISLSKRFDREIHKNFKEEDEILIEEEEEEID